VRRSGLAAVLFLAVLIVSQALGAPTRVVVVDDPSGALGTHRQAVEQAASRLAGGATRRAGRASDAKLIVVAVPALGGRDPEKIIAQRHSKLANGGSSSDLVTLLSVRERKAVVAVAIDKGSVVKLLGPSSAATKAYASGDPVAALKAGVTAIGKRSKRDEADGWKGWASLLIIPLLIGGLVELVRGLRAWGRLRGVPADITPAGLVGPGTAMVRGVAVASQPLLAPVTGKPCVHYRVQGSEFYWDPGHRPDVWNDDTSQWEKRQAEPEGGWSDIGTASDRTPFFVRDASGDVEVLPEGAEITPLESFSGDVKRKKDAYYAIDVPEVQHSDGRRHYDEEIVPVGAEVTVLGTVTLDGGRPRFRQSGRERFLVTLKGPGRVRLGDRWRTVTTLAVSGACFAGALVDLVLVAS
jgi:hypothetical protein